MRDHKKIVTIDDRIAYVGGINFSAHNFLWHDLMVRMADPEVAGWLARDMRSTLAQSTLHEDDGQGLCEHVSHWALHLARPVLGQVARR